MTENLLLRCSSSLIVLLLITLLQTSLATTHSRICSPSTCGVIRNISFPFRLKNDPKHCGDSYYELSCENNATTVLVLNSQKYQVKAINYVNQTIWMADVSVDNNSTCSFPNVSLNSHFLGRSPYTTRTSNYNVTSQDISSVDSAWPISLMRCPYPLKNSSLFTELPAHCNSSTSYTYINVASMNASDIRDNCSVDLVVLTSWNFKNVQNASLSEIHDSLLYGFQLYWYGSISCIDCHGRSKCGRSEGEIATCGHFLGEMLEELRDHMYSPNDNSNGPTSAFVLIFLLILVCFFAGVGLPAKIIIGFICACGFVIVEINNNYFNTYWHMSHLRLVIGIFFALRFIMVLLFLMWLLIYKFRRRHLSRYDAIEDFLQSDNKIMPIRYSYSDIKKMTRGFKEKLGQGGYGTVYKGKLRSGYDVAVKLLGRSGGNGQDFMNEIATIGRIHHVNVVNLVGYCAERSKRVLIFDFMPNSSLDKYIFGREQMNSLTWERMHKIAIGVARGIEYLHTGCDIQILHFDIKPHNILLDENFTPKITDFGLAKFFSTDKNVVTMTAVRGTIGYVAPELINRGIGEVSYKADVYSFGMLLVEMAGLNRDFNRNNQASSQYFPCWIYDCFDQGHDIEFRVTDENNDNTNKEITKKMTIVALWCIQMNPCDRPSMRKVVEMLEAPMERLRVPNRPPQLAHIAANYENHSWSTYSTDATTLLSRDVACSTEITIED